MTIIAAMSTGTEAWIGGDSAIGNDDFVTTIDYPKYVQVQDLVIGAAGSLRILNSLRFNDFDFDSMEGTPEQRVYSIDQMLHTVYNKEEYSVLYAHATFVAESSNNADLYFGRVGAIGTGYQYALGNMHTKKPGYLAVYESLEAAITYSTSCKMPVWTRHLC